MTNATKVVVTGAAGHLGSHLIPLLGAEGFEVIGLDVVSSSERSSPGCRFVQADLIDASAVRKAIEGATIIVHCASIHPWKTYSDDQYLDCNIKGTWTLYRSAAELGIGRIVLTSSIAAAGYGNVPPKAWPVSEDLQFPLGDLYSLTKHVQEDIAQMFANNGKIRTIALRPPAFMPVPDMETGFRLTGAFALVEDIASAHAAATRVMSGLQEPGAPLKNFEAFNITNKLPYTRDDGPLREPDGNLRPLVKRYWPEAYEWLVAHGYQGAWLPAVYDVSRAKRLLDWEPIHNFEQWYEEHRNRT